MPTELETLFSKVACFVIVLEKNLEQREISLSTIKHGDMKLTENNELFAVLEFSVFETNQAHEHTGLEVKRMGKIGTTSLGVIHCVQYMNC